MYTGGTFCGCVFDKFCPIGIPTSKFFLIRILKIFRQCPYATDIHKIVHFPPMIGSRFGIHLCPFLSPCLRFYTFLVCKYELDLRKPSVDYPFNCSGLQTQAELLKSLPYICPYDRYRKRILSVS